MTVEDLRATVDELRRETVTLRLRVDHLERGHRPAPPRTLPVREAPRALPVREVPPAPAPAPFRLPLCRRRPCRGAPIPPSAT